MKMYLVAFAAGTLVGAIYALLGVRSPAPPIVALVGLLGILAGEQLVPLAKRLATGERVSAAWVRAECAPHVLGELPRGASATPSPAPPRDPGRSA